MIDRREVGGREVDGRKGRSVREVGGRKGGGWTERKLVAGREVMDGREVGGWKGSRRPEGEAEGRKGSWWL